MITHSIHLKQNYKTDNQVFTLKNMWANISQAAVQTKPANPEDMQWLCPVGEVGPGANAEQAKHRMKSGPWKMRSAGSSQHQSNKGRRYWEHRENGFERALTPNVPLVSSTRTVSIRALSVVWHNTRPSILSFSEYVWGLTPWCGESTTLWILEQYNPINPYVNDLCFTHQGQGRFFLYTNSPEHDVSHVWGSLKSTLILSGSVLFFLT